MHAVARSLRLSENDCRNLLESLTPGMPRLMEAILGDEEARRPKLSF
jgi:hypothetical protein